MTSHARFLWLVALAVLVAVLLIGLRFFLDRSRDIAAARESLAVVAADIVHDLDEKIRGTEQLLYSLARASDLEVPDRAACSRFLSDVREANPQYTGILTINPDGALYCDSLQTGRELDLTDRAYFKAASAAATGIALEPTFGRLTGTSVLQIAHPVRADAGDLRFVLLASFNLQTFAAGLQRDQQDADILFIDKAGTVLVWRASDGQAMRPGSSIAETELFQLIAAQDTTAAGELTDAAGKQQIWAVAPPSLASQVGLRVAVGVPEARVVAAAQWRLIQDALILAAISLLLVAGVWLLGRRAARQDGSEGMR
jgi:hypothetical protein